MKLALGGSGIDKCSPDGDLMVWGQQEAPAIE